MSGKNDENKTNIAVNKVLCNPVRTQLLDCKTNTQNIEVNKVLCNPVRTQLLDCKTNTQNIAVRFVLHLIVLVLQS